MDIQKTTAENIKNARLRRKLTLDAASKLSGVSRSMLAQIEKGEVNPTISTIWKIANGYRVSFTSLVESHKQEPLLLRAEDTQPLATDEGRYLNFPAFPFRDHRLFETYRIQIKPGGRLLAQPHMAGCEEYLTVFTGQLAVRAGQTVFQLAEGDSLRFAADVEHEYKNTGNTVVQLHMLIYYEK